MILELKLKIKLFYLISALFIIFNAVFMYFEVYYFALFPFFLVTLLIAFIAIDKLVLLVVFLTPLSVPLHEFVPNFPIDMHLPTEPILAGIMFMFFLRLLTEKNIDIRVFKHPISILIYLNVIWLFITSISSSMPLVSFKYLLVRVWFLTAFYFLAVQIFSKYSNIKKYLWFYIIPLLIVAIYTVARHVGYGIFDKDAAHFVMSPFYKDHTSYGALLAMYFPILLGFGINSRYSSNSKFMIWAVIIFFLIAIILSYTRAAWVSLIGALGVFLILVFRIKFRFLFLVGAIIISLLFIYRVEIFQKLEKNEQDSSADLKEHVKSMSNVASDASNLERINRWKSAVKMFEERPVLG